MSDDDLLKRLWESDEASALTNQAARRIEELEAKLAKALLALERIASGEFSGRMLTSMPPQDAAQYFARTTLAEMKGEDRR
jgi:flagellar motility protein MotE (MotC chaperone)